MKDNIHKDIAFPAISHMSLVWKFEYRSVSNEKPGLCETETMDKCQSFLFIIIIHLSLPKAMQGDSLKVSPLAPHLIRNKLHLQGSAPHLGSKHTCSVLASPQHSEKKERVEIKPLYLSNRCYLQKMPLCQVAVFRVSASEFCTCNNDL